MLLFKKVQTCLLQGIVEQFAVSTRGRCFPSVPVTPAEEPQVDYKSPQDSLAFYPNTHHLCVRAAALQPAFKPRWYRL